MDIPSEEIMSLTEFLIEIPSVTGEESAVTQFIYSWMHEQEWKVIEIPVDESRSNLLVVFGHPRVLFTTHVDVVPAAARLFHPRRTKNVLWGRGACDSKGSIATMLVLAKELLKQNKTNFALLFVVGEEVDGIGAQVATQYLRGLGVHYLINGEPTDGKYVAATKGVLDFDILCRGRSCHSGYPSYGEDANRALIQCAQKLYAQTYGTDPVLGKGVINIGKIKAGTATNVVSQFAQMSGCIRTVEKDNERVRSFVSNLVYPAQVIFTLDVPAISLSVPTWEKETYIAAYVSDVGHFGTLGCKLYLCGPGSILCAHTDEERISVSEIEEAYLSYQRLFESIEQGEEESNVLKLRRAN